MRSITVLRVVACIVSFLPPLAATAGDQVASAPVVIKNARVFDGKSDKLSEDLTVVVVGNKIDKIGKNLAVPAGATVIDAGRRVLMPGLIDAHVHLAMVLPPAKLLTTDPGYAYALMQKAQNGC